MAFQISDFNGAVIPPDSTYPNGQVKDDPGGTRVDRTMVGDIVQFFQRVMDDAGVTPNDLEDNADNGFQLVEALNTLYSRRFGGMAQAFGTPAGTYVPVVMSGLAPVSAGYTAGFFFYNGKFYFAPTFVNTTFPALGHSVVLTLGTVDAQPVVTGAGVASTVVPSAVSFNYEDRVSWSESVGIDQLQSEVAALIVQNTLASWANLSVSAPFATHAATGGAILGYRTDGMGRVYVRGGITSSAWPAADTLVATLPAGARPAAAMNILILQPASNSGAMFEIATSGTITYKYRVGDGIVNAPLYFDALNFLNS